MKTNKNRQVRTPVVPIALFVLFSLASLPIFYYNLAWETGEETTFQVKPTGFGWETEKTPSDEIILPQEIKTPVCPPSAGLRQAGNM